MSIIANKLINVKHFPLNCYNNFVDFHAWINKKYVEWRGDAIGRDHSQKEFADWVGISPSLMTYWLKRNGKIPKHQKTVNKLVRRFGPEVYEVLGIPPPPLFIQKLEALYDELDQDRQRQLMKRISEILDEFIRSDHQ